HSTMTFDRPRPHIVTLVIVGRDVGEHGDAPLRVLDDALRAGSFALYIDARDTLGASIDVSNIWAQWLRRNRHQLQEIHMLTGSRFVQPTADFVRRFAELGGARRVYTDRAAVDEPLQLVT